MAIFRSVPPAAASEMVMLADFAYDEGKSLDALFGKSGWRALGADDLGLPDRFFDAKGYYENRSSDGYAAINGDTFALVFRGSNNTGDLLKTALDQNSYYDNLKSLIDSSFNYIASHDLGTVEMTGQSLGGAMVMRTAAKNDLGDIGSDVTWRLMTFGSPGTDVDNTSSDSRSIVNVYHTGDPVPTDPLLDRLTEHGSKALIQLPNVENADSLAELAEQWQDPSRVTEHDVERYVLSVQAIAKSPLYADTADKTVAVVLDADDGSPRNDVYQVKDSDRLVLGLGGNDVLDGSGGRDLLDGGAGNDALNGAGGDDVLNGGSGRDQLAGGSGYDRFDYNAASDSGPGAALRDVIADFMGAGAATGDRIDLSTIDALASKAGNQAFVFNGTSAITGPGQVQVAAAGADTVIEANTTGSLAPDLEILVKDGAALPGQWVAGDFIL